MRRTAVAVASVHVELARQEGEAVAIPGCGRRAGRRGREVGPADVGGVVDVEVVEQTCDVDSNHGEAVKRAR